jgi:hypothetical protein
MPSDGIAAVDVPGTRYGKTAELIRVLEPILKDMVIAWQHCRWEARDGCQEEAVGDDLEDTR